MKLSEFILENVTRIQREELDRGTYQPDCMHFNKETSSGKCYICTAGYIRALEGRETCELSKQDEVLNLCREGMWREANYILRNEKKFIELPKPLFHDFIGWWQFKKHIESLKERALTLKEIGY